VDAREAYRRRGETRTNPKRGGVGASRHRRAFERSEREVKVTRADVRRLRLLGDDRPGNTSKARPATAKGHGGSGEGHTIRYQTIRLSNEFLNCSVDPEDQTNPMRAARHGFGRVGIESTLKPLQGRSTGLSTLFFH
jgi:hypothetical protein